MENSQTKEEGLIFYTVRFIVIGNLCPNHDWLGVIYNSLIKERLIYEIRHLDEVTSLHKY